MREKELYKACNILFGPEVDVTFDFLQYIQHSGVKSAYRRLARITHPDVAVEEGGGASSERFIKASWAYESLSEYIKSRELSPVPGMFQSAGQDTVRRSDRKDSESAQGKPMGNCFRGDMPARRLMFGEFLFYCGAVSWESLIKAIVWQRNQRPRLGDLASKWGWIGQQDVSRILRSREYGETIGEVLIRLGICTSLQVRALLRTQRKMQKPFGEFFIDNGYLARGHVNSVLYKEFLKHNSIYK